MSDLILLERGDDGIALLTVNRPEARNALSRALVAELGRVVEDLVKDRDLRVLIITGAGDRAFCAGADLIERTTMPTEERTAHTGAILSVIEQIAALPIPVIAAMRGYALAGGSELALACDFRIGSTTAVLGFPEVKIGIFPGAGGVARLPRLVGASAANDLLMTGRQVKSDEAFRLGLLDSVVESDDVIPAARAKAIEIAEVAPLAVRAIKAALRESDGLSIAAANAVIAKHRRPLDDTADYAEGLAAFAEKRKPRFTGE